MTKAGDRILCRKTTVTYIPTGDVITITNADIPADKYQPRHSEQMDHALAIICELVERPLARKEVEMDCVFDFSVVEVE